MDAEASGVQYKAETVENVEQYKQYIKAILLLKH